MKLDISSQKISYETDRARHEVDVNSLRNTFGLEGGIGKPLSVFARHTERASGLVVAAATTISFLRDRNKRPEEISSRPLGRIVDAAGTVAMAASLLDKTSGAIHGLIGTESDLSNAAGGIQDFTLEDTPLSGSEDKPIVDEDIFDPPVI